MAKGRKRERDEASVAQFCTVLPSLRAAARDEGWTAMLEEVEAQVRERSGSRTEVVDRLWEQLGLRGIRGRGRPLGLAPSGQDPAQPPQGVYRCPASDLGLRCTRTELRSPSGPVPECALLALPLRFVG